MSSQTNTAPAPVKVPKRFSVIQRIEHIVLIVSFTTLGLTGLAQKFSSNELAAAFIQLLGGIGGRCSADSPSPPWHLTRSRS